MQVSVDGHVLATKVPGDAFGEMALVSAEKRSADVIAMGLCDLAVLERDDYLAVVQEKQNATMALKLKLIKSNPLFGCLSGAQQEAFAKCGKLQRFEGGEYITRQVGLDCHLRGAAVEAPPPDCPRPTARARLPAPDCPPDGAPKPARS